MLIIFICRKYLGFLGNPANGGIGFGRMVARGRSRRKRQAMNDAVLNEFRAIAAEMKAAKDGSADRSWTWCGPFYWVSDLTEEQARKRLAQYGGSLRIWNGSRLVPAQ